MVLLLFTSCIPISESEKYNSLNADVSWSGMGLSRKFETDKWTISADRATGYISGDVNSNITSLHVENTNSGGKVSLTLTQGDTEKNVDINGKFNEEIDISSFEQGISIELRLVFESAENVNVLITIGNPQNTTDPSQQNDSPPWENWQVSPSPQQNDGPPIMGKQDDEPPIMGE